MPEFQRWRAVLGQRARRSVQPVPSAALVRSMGLRDLRDVPTVGCGEVFTLHLDFRGPAPEKHAGSHVTGPEQVDALLARIQKLSRRRFPAVRSVRAASIERSSLTVAVSAYGSLEPTSVGGYGDRRRSRAMNDRIVIALLQLSADVVDAVTAHTRKLGHRELAVSARVELASDVMQSNLCRDGQFARPRDLVDAFAQTLNAKDADDLGELLTTMPSSSTSWECACVADRGLSTATAGPLPGRSADAASTSTRSTSSMSPTT
jgi:hypothetical protein